MLCLDSCPLHMFVCLFFRQDDLTVTTPVASMVNRSLTRYAVDSRAHPAGRTQKQNCPDTSILSESLTNSTQLTDLVHVPHYNQVPLIFLKRGDFSPRNQTILACGIHAAFIHGIWRVACYKINLSCVRVHSSLPVRTCRLANTWLHLHGPVRVSVPRTACATSHLV